MNYQNKRIVIIGMGITGLSCLNYFLSKGITPKVIDTKKSFKGIEKIPAEVEIHTGSFHLEWMLDADLLVVSPGIAISTPEIAQAINQGVEVIGDIELFCREINQIGGRVIAITGANGKSTVTSLLGQMALSNHLKTAVGGNIGLPVLSCLNEPYDLYVLELSSFQLETTKSLQTVAATILNISEDHLDRYQHNIDNYIAAKQVIYEGAECCVYYQKDKHTYPKQMMPTAKRLEFGGLESPYRIETIDEEAWMIADNTALMPCKELGLNGYHNHLNALAALALSACVGIKAESCIEVLKSFTGLEHRFLIVHEENGITWVNDSKATNVGSVLAALTNFNVGGCIHLLMGGDSKAADLEPLRSLLNDDNKRIYCYGRDGQSIAKLSSKNSIYLDTMAQSLHLARKNARAGDWIILSPACASLDQFDNYQQRGNLFIELAKTYN